MFDCVRSLTGHRQLHRDTRALSAARLALCRCGELRLEREFAAVSGRTPSGLGPYHLRAAFSHLARLGPLFLWQAFSLALSFCARVGDFFFAQPVTEIAVLLLIFAPFCATNSVGIASLLAQRFPFAASALN